MYAGVDLCYIAVVCHSWRLWSAPVKSLDKFLLCEGQHLGSFNVHLRGWDNCIDVIIQVWVLPSHCIHTW